MIDFTNCPVNRFRAYGGANGNKINISYEGSSYMLKFPPRPSRNKEMSYTNGCISEYVACHIFEMLGFRVQDTLQVCGAITRTAEARASWWLPAVISQRAENG